jgi:hypothetical protein
MLFHSHKSALTRLSDTLKIGFDECARTIDEILEYDRRYGSVFASLQTLARRHLAGDIAADDLDVQAQRILEAIPESDRLTGAQLQQTLHTQVLSVLLNTCFCLEAYINSLVFFLAERKYPGLHPAALAKMGTLQKWEAVGKLGGSSFDTSRTPFQAFKILFRFRDDHVHNKVVPLSKDLGARRYGGRFPDPVVGFLDLGHALQGGEIYWSMITEVHQLLSVPTQEFQRHYDLTPWGGEQRRRTLQRLADGYRRTVLQAEN